MIQALWDRYFHEGVTGSYHGDMAHAFASMLEDVECSPVTKQKVWRAILVHMAIERRHDHQGRKWFCERWGREGERR